MEYTDLEVWKIAHELVLEIHKITLSSLPSFERTETGSQIRRSSKSVKSNIVEGYGRREYKQEFIRFLIIAKASSDETRDHLITLYETGSFRNREKFQELKRKLDLLRKKLDLFISAVKQKHRC